MGNDFYPCPATELPQLLIPWDNPAQIETAKNPDYMPRNQKSLNYSLIVIITIIN
jgi:hypothetical protein